MRKGQDKIIQKGLKGNFTEEQMNILRNESYTVRELAILYNFFVAINGSDGAYMEFESVGIKDLSLAYRLILYINAKIAPEDIKVLLSVSPEEAYFLASVLKFRPMKDAVKCLEYVKKEKPSHITNGEIYYTVFSLDTDMSVDALIEWNRVIRNKLGVNFDRDDVKAAIDNGLAPKEFKEVLKKGELERYILKKRFPNVSMLRPSETQQTSHIEIAKKVKEIVGERTYFIICEPSTYVHYNCSLKSLSASFSLYSGYNSYGSSTDLTKMPSANSPCFSYGDTAP